MRLLMSLLAVAALSGCAAPTLYQWGGYESLQYAAYKDPTKAEAMKIKLDAHIVLMETSGKKVAPGLYAELGTLYFQAGVRDKALAMYSRERDTWPESKTLMTAMIKNIERRPASAAVKP